MKKKLTIDTIVLCAMLSLFVLQLPMSILFSYMIGVIYFFSSGSRLYVSCNYFNICIAFVFLFLPAALTFNHGAVPLFYLSVSPFLIFFAYKFSMNSLEHIQCVCRNIYWIFVLFIVIALIWHWGEPEPLGAILPWVSTNGIPSYLIVVQIAYSIAFYLKNNRLPLLSSSVTLGVAIFGLGRGSIIIGVLILVLTVYFNLFFIRPKKYRSFFLFSLLFSVILFFTLFAEKGQVISNEIQTLVEGSKFASGILDEHRAKIVSDYLDKMDGMGLIVGESYNNTSINDYYGGNPHNSFIRVHSFFGLAAFISLFLPIFLVVISRRNRHQKLVVLSFVMLALFRAASEPIFFPSTLDFFYFLYFALFFRFARMKAKSNTNLHDAKNNHC